MSVAVQVSDIFSQVAFRLNQKDIGTSSFIPTAKAIQMLNMCLDDLTNLLARLYGDSHFVQTATTQTQINDPTVSLPQGCTDVQAVCWLIDGTRRQRLGVATLDEVNSTAYQTWDWSANGFYQGLVPLTGFPKYLMRGNTIVIWPKPTAVYNLEITYSTGVPNTVVTASDTLLMPVPGCANYLVGRMCEILSSREDLLPLAAAQASFRQYSEDALTQAASNRDQYADAVVQDVRTGQGWGHFRSRVRGY